MKIQVYLHPPNTNMNTQKYGLEKVTPFHYDHFYPFLVSMFNFWGLAVKLCNKKSVHLGQDVTHSNPFHSCQPSQKQPTESMIILGIPSRLRLPNSPPGPRHLGHLGHNFQAGFPSCRNIPGMLRTSEKQIEPEYDYRRFHDFKTSTLGEKSVATPSHAPRPPNSSHPRKKSQALGTEDVIFRDLRYTNRSENSSSLPVSHQRTPRVFPFKNPGHHIGSKAIHWR